jgi:hypothetical protein
MVDARCDLNEHAAGLTVRPRLCERVMVQSHLNGGEFTHSFDSGFYVGRDSHMDIFREGKRGEEKRRAEHLWAAQKNCADSVADQFANVPD